MYEEQNLERYECSLSEHKHFVQQPVQTSCGHYTCRNCIPVFNQQEQEVEHRVVVIKCNICGRKSEIKERASSLPVSASIKNGEMSQMNGFLKEFQMNVEKIVSLFEIEFEKSIQLVRENLKTIHECIETRIEYIKNEIELRIDSIKIELDRLNVNLRNELDESKTQLIREIKRFDIEPYESLLTQMKTNANSNQTQQVATLNEYKKQLHNLNQMNDEIKHIDYKVTFEPSTMEIDSNLIGNISYSYGDSSASVAKRLKCQNYQTYDVKFRIHDVCLLSNGDLLAAVFDQSNLVVYDRNFEIKNCIERINHDTFKPISIDCDPLTKQIYICDFGNHKILILDSDFNFVKSTGSKGTELFQFNSPSSICFSLATKHLYVCDTSNKRVHKLSQNFETDEIFNFQFMPSRIKIINSTACIRASSICSVYFYDLEKFQMKWKYDGHNGSISVVRSNFCEYYYLNKIFYCYDETGVLNEELQLNLVDLIRDKTFSETANHTRIIEFHSKLLITCQESKKVILVGN